MTAIIFKSMKKKKAKVGKFHRPQNKMKKMGKEKRDPITEWTGGTRRESY